MPRDPLPLDVLIFGGGAAGLWLLDDLVRAGYSTLLLEAHALGSGQTVASQGILHGGFKYTLSGAFSDAADAIKHLPELWRRCLRGEATPDLRSTPVRSEFCHLWSTGRLLSKLGMMAASWVLQVKPQSVPRDQWPAILQGCRGSVSRLEEQVIDPRAFLADLAGQHRERLLHIGGAVTCDMRSAGDGAIVQVELIDKDADRRIVLEPRFIVLSAGNGNAELRARFNLAADAMQVRPVHLIMARGNLPAFHGHCIDGNKTRVTITSNIDSQGRHIWQIGGQISEDGVTMQREELIDHAKRELGAVLPGFELEGVEWSTYRADRAEGATRGGARPANAVILHEGNIITVWPTKLVLAPQASRRVTALLDGPRHAQPDLSLLKGLPRPAVALPPWETETQWIR